MTDRLALLLRDEADRLDVPPPPAAAALHAGRRVRRRRRVTRMASAAAVAAALGVGAAVWTGHDATRPPEVADSTVGIGPTADVDAVFAVGDTVYLHSGLVAARMDEVAQTLYYTSAGLLVRTNATGRSDGGGPFHFTLVTTNGSISRLPLELGEVVPSTDPREPYLAYAATSGDGVEVVVTDVRTGEEAARFPVPGVADWGGWEAPPVDLDGDEVYVGSGAGAVAVNWRTGEVRESTPVAAYPEVSGNRTVVSDADGVRVLDATTGSVVLAVPSPPKHPLLLLSPDGRRLIVGDATGPDGAAVYRVDTGDRQELPGRAGDYGWTSTSQPYTVDEDGITYCAMGTHCLTAPPTGNVAWGGFVRLGGRVFES